MPKVSLDLVVATVVAVAALRGLMLGLVREAFSLGALAAAVISIRLLTGPTAEALQPVLGDRVPAMALKAGSACLVALAGVATVALFGRLVRRGVKAAGLGFADRIAGAGLGAAEGLLVVSLGLAVLSAAIGRDHPALTTSQAYTYFDRAERAIVGERPAPHDVSAPPPALRSKTTP
jgi:membrane protein required for colicin V production